MEQRQIIKEQIILNIPVNRNSFDSYKPGIRWSELIETKNVLPTDIISEVGYRTEKENGFGSMKMDDELEDIHIATLVVIRNRPETDDEFLKRQKEKNNFQHNIEEREKLEYLRLKAKYDKS